MDIPVEFLLENLKQLIVYHYKLITGAKAELELLVGELDALNAILKDASKNHQKNEVVNKWEKRVRETVYDIEDAIDTCVTELAARKAKNFVGRQFSATPITLAQLVKSIREDKVKTLVEFQAAMITPNLNQSEKPDTTAEDNRRRIRQTKRKTRIVGMDDEARKLIGFLKEPSEGLEVVSIIGMPGLGKTTVAWKMFQDEEIELEFPTRIWVNISEDLNMRKVLLTILKKFTNQVPADTVSSEELCDTVRNTLSSQNFLIVMDDVWSTETWDKLKSFLPMDNHSSRILITTRERNVATHANVTKNTHNHMLRFLTEIESWELLQCEVYGNATAPEDLVNVGKLISKNCDGLPLSLVVMGGILKDKISDAQGIVALIKEEWEAVSTKIQHYLVSGDKTKRLENIIGLSYEKLPYELRDCFLYLGVFPEDADIPAKKLTLLWMAEGFVKAIEGWKSLEEVAHDNLKDLINRNLLMVEKAKLSGEAKICRVHDMIRHFCITEAGPEKLNLFKEISFNNGVFEPSLENIGKFRRLCVHSNAYDFFRGKQSAHKARSFLCFTKSPIQLDSKGIAAVTESFQLLRVLDAEDMKFPKFPVKVGELIHLRYLTLTFFGDQMKFIPPVISKLWNLQTLFVDIPSRKLLIKANIWMMRYLRHLKTKASIVLHNDGHGGDAKDEGKGGENLQTLERLSPESCTAGVFSKAKNLRKLGIQGDLNIILNSNSLEKLNLLKTLKLVHQDASGRAMQKLPVSTRFPPTLEIIVLTGTSLKWQEMSVLGSLRLLKALKLKENAFVGKLWDVDAADFQALRLLDIERADVQTWKAAKGSFSSLRLLSLTSCVELEEVPDVLGEKLEVLTLASVKQSCVLSAKKFEKARGDLLLKVAPHDKSNVV